MREVLAGHQVISLHNLLDVIIVNANGDPHDHMLRSLCNFAIQAKEVRSLQSLEAEILIIEVTVVYDGGVELFGMFHDSLVRSLGDHGRSLLVFGIDIVVEIRYHRRELLLRLLMQVRDGDSCSKYGVIRMGYGHVRRCFSRLEVKVVSVSVLLRVKWLEPLGRVGAAYQVVEFDSGNALVDTRDDLLGDGRGVDMIWI